MNGLKAFGVWCFYALYIYRLTRWWYALTMWWSQLGEVQLRPVKSYRAISEALSGGARWRPDPLGGIFDNVYHPSQVQLNIDMSEPVGDCDDHAVYWCAMLLRSKLARRAWLSFYQYRRADGVVGGHVVCVFESVDTGADGKPKLFWVDYGLPELITSRDAWIDLLCARKSRTLLGAAEIPVTHLREDDTPVLGPVSRLKH